MESSKTVNDMSELVQKIISITDFISRWKPLYFILGGLIPALLFLIFKRHLISRRECWLSTRIAKAKKELKGKQAAVPCGDKLVTYFSQLYYPTWSKFFILLLVLGAVFGSCTKYFWIPYDQAEFYRSLVPIQIGIVALIFPIMIFIIGFSGNKMASGVNLSEVLLRESFLFPVGVAGLFFLVNLIWARSSYVIIAQIILSAFMYATVLFRVIRILLDDQRLLEKSKALLQDKLRRSIERTIEERLGNNILMKELGENKIELQYAFFESEKNGTVLTKINLGQKGVIADINLANLKKIAQIIERTSRLKGISFFENALDLGKGGDTSVVAGDPSNIKTFKKDKERYLRKRFMDSVTEENPCVLSFQKDIVDDKCILDEIKDIANKTFCIKKDEEDAEKLRIELRNLKDQLIDDIRNERLGRISNLKEVYISLGELFLNIMKSYSSNYSMEMARKERSNIVGEWIEVQWLTDDLRDIYEIALKSQNRDVIQQIGYLPVAIAHRAIKMLDHYIFEKSFGFLGIYYMHALRKSDHDLQTFMKERCGAYLEETADYAVQYELGKIELGEERVSQFRDFAFEIFLQLQHLIKQAYDAKDLETFKAFVAIGGKLFSHFRPSEEHPDAEHYKWQLKLPDIKEDEKQKIESKLKEKEFLESIEKDLKQKKNEMFFGLASFILDEYRNDKQKKDLLEYFNALSSRLPSDLKELTAMFLKCHDFDVEHFWGWGWWTLPMDGEVHSIDFLGKTTFLYCVKALQIANTSKAESLEKIGLPHSRDFVHMVEKEDSIIKKTITDLLNESAEWDGIVPLLEAGKKDALFKAFDIAKEKQIKEEEDFLINSKLSQAKIGEFIKGFFGGYKGNCAMHALFEKCGQYDDQIRQVYRGSQKSMGYNRLDDKGAFIDGWYVHYLSHGEQYGSGMASWTLPH